MAENVKVYEEKKGLPIWAWLIPLLLLLALAAYFLTHHKTQPGSDTAAVSSTGVPSLGDVHFDTDQATLSPQAKTTLDQAAAYMKHHPEAHLRLEGYTDSTGTAAHNDTLSDRRAQSVAAYLKELNVDPARITGQGFGESNPKDTNATPGGKADNRRVELFSQQ